MVTYFNKKDLIDFANYVMSPEVMNKKKASQALVVTHADFHNWKFDVERNKKQKFLEEIIASKQDRRIVKENFKSSKVLEKVWSAEKRDFVWDNQAVYSGTIQGDFTK